MPMFHLNVFNDIVAMDEEGSELPNLQAAISSAIRAARELMAHAILARQPIRQGHRVEITDEAGNLLHTVKFGEVFRLLR